MQILEYSEIFGPIRSCQNGSWPLNDAAVDCYHYWKSGELVTSKGLPVSGVPHLYHLFHPLFSSNFVCYAYVSSFSVYTIYKFTILSLFFFLLFQYMYSPTLCFCIVPFILCLCGKSMKLLLMG